MAFSPLFIFSLLYLIYR